MNNLKETVLLVHLEPQTKLKISERSDLSSRYHFVSLDSSDEAINVLKSLKGPVTSVVLGSELKNPIQTSQRLYALNHDTSVIILSDKENSANIERSILFTPFLGKFTTCAVEQDFQKVVSVLEQMVDAVIKHRKSKLLSEKMNFDLHKISIDKQNAVGISTQFVERLLDIAPIGIVTLDEAGRVVAANRAAEPMLGMSEVKSLGKDIRNFFPKLLLDQAMNKEISSNYNHNCIFDVNVTPITGSDQGKGHLLIITDITDRKRVMNDLQHALKARDEFISIASHELKTPLTSLKIQFQLQKRQAEKGNQKYYSKEKVDANTDMALKLISRLDRLIDDMLDIARIRTGKLTIKKQTLNLTSLLREVVGNIQNSSRASILIVHSDECTVHIDPLRVEQVINNILQNALKYGGGGKVEVKLFCEKGSAHISVKDYGPGISETDQKKIFQPFERAISANEISGLGLGLFISQQMIAAHNGKIWVESELGKGSTFHMEIPC